MVRLFVRLSYLAATLIFVRSPDDVLLALLLFCGAELGMSATLFALSFQISPWTFSWAGAVRTRTVLQEAWPLAFYVVNAGLLYYVDLAIIGLRLPMEDAGLYAGAMRIVTGMVGLKFLIGQLIYPKLARRVGSAADAPELARLVCVIDRYGLMLGIGLLTVTVLFAREIVWFVLGSQFVAGWWVLALLSVVLIAEFGWLAYPYLAISMNFRVYAAIMVFMGVLKIGSLYVMLPKGGLLAAALIYVACSLFVCLASIAYVTRRLVTVPVFRLVAMPLAFVAAVLALGLTDASVGFRLALSGVVIAASALYARSLGQQLSWSGVKNDLRLMNT